MEIEETLRAIEQSDTVEQEACRRRARQAVRLLLGGQQPPEGEQYGPWTSHVTRLLRVFAQEGERGVQTRLAIMLHEEGKWARDLLQGAVTPTGQRWRDVLAKAWEVMEEQQRKAAAERRMQERLARSTGDSMADEILAMLRERDLSRTDIYRRYSRNVSAERINDALFVLERLGWARWKAVSTGGRKREVWYLPSDEEQEA